MQSWFPSSLPGSSISSGSNAPTNASMMSPYRTSDRPQSPSTGFPSPSEAAGVIPRIKDKSQSTETMENHSGWRLRNIDLQINIDELRKLLTDKGSYEAFFNSLEQVKDQSNLRRELREETLQIARDNLEKATRMSELKNQCMIIRTTELASALEKLKELEKQKDEILRLNSPTSVLHNLQDSINKVDEESENLHNRLIEKDVDLATFLQKYKRLRITYHKRALTHLAAKTSI